MKCPHCGQINQAGQKFCGECGLKLPLEAEQVFGGRNYTPAHIAQKILQSRSAVEGERKQVTVLFCDIASSTPLAARLGADRMHKLLNSFFEVALEAVHRYEGTVNQFLGDGLMALFGAPISHEDHARRAAMAAMAIRQAVGQHAALQEQGVEIKTRIGLNSGAVVVGGIGDNLRMDYTAVGDTTNVAARIQALAAPGSILASGNVARAVEQRIECRPIGPHALKGKDEPFELYELVSERAQGNLDRAAAAQALIGRRREVEAIAQALSGQVEGQGRIVAIYGEAGLGKSRLLQHAVQLAGQRGVRILRGTCLSFGRTLSYWAFREAMLEAFGILETDPEAARWPKFERGMRQLLGEEAEDLLTYAGSLLAVTLPEARAKQALALDTQSMGHQIFRATYIILEKLARAQATLLVLEDWHWADASSASLLEHVLSLVERVPLVILLASRPEPHGPAALLKGVLSNSDRASQATSLIELAPLQDQDVAQIARQAAGAVIPLQATQMVLKRSAGNPFYAGELVRALIATGALDHDPATGEWRATERFGSAPLPEAIEGVILARIDRLEDEVKQVLKTASVVGRSFFYRVLKAITDIEVPIDDDLTQLRRADLIDEKQIAPELEYIFKHPLIQQATYDSLLEDRRRALHRRVGLCIEALFAERLDAFHSMLAYHFVRAGEEAKGREYLLKAAQQADRLAADEEALELYGAVIEALERESVGEIDAVRRAELEAKLGEAHFRAGRHEQALPIYSRALKRLGLAPPKSRWRVGLSVALALAHWAIRPWIPAAMAPRYRTLSPREALACQIWENMMWINFFLDMPMGVYGVAQIGRLSARDPRSRAHMIGLSHAGMMCTTVGLYKAASWSHRRAIALSLEFGDELTRGNAEHFMAWHLHEVGRWPEAMELDAASAKRVWSSGNLRLWFATQVDQALFSNSLGRPYRHVVDRMREVVEQTPDRHARSWMLTADGMELQRQGKHSEAIASLDEAIAIYRATPDNRTLALGLGLRARSLHRLGDFDEARHSCEEAESLISRYSLTGTVSTIPLLAAAELRIAQFESAPDDETQKRAAKRAVRAMWRQGKRVHDDGDVERFRVAGALAWLLGQRNQALQAWSEGLKRSQELDARYARARILFERGTRTRSADDVRQAGEWFESAEAFGEVDLTMRWVNGNGVEDTNR